MKNEKKNKTNWIALLLFIGYMILLIYFLFFSERYGRTTSSENYRYNLEPFREIKRYFIYRHLIGTELFFVNVVGNIAAFIPFGYVLPLLREKNNHFLYVFLSGVQFTVIVETIQLLTKVGTFDVDDMILNVIGVIIGYLLVKLSIGLVRLFSKKAR